MIHSCKEIAAAIARGDVPGLPWHGRAAVHFHLIICRHCRRYAAQLDAIAAAVRNVYGQTPARNHSLEESILESLRHP